MKLGKPLATGVVEEQRVVTASFEPERDSGAVQGMESGAGARETGADGLPAVAEVSPGVARR
ncbi:hypothetical protein [Streptomyces sp. SID3343]|uniref:hypothetical protein n=1 Tax=Streptomyces sp. SID3343 TaxID=2690260 RepID=UPI001370222E|nr:hypothetical protein [Streptomyces sp. SID3343]MYW05832.1 hypothetical protein [Streptomyces sp. SID3343]